MRNYLDISGHIELEGSKSILNRVLIIASYLKSPIKIINPSSCADITTMTDNMCKMGLKFDKFSDTWIVTPPAKLVRKGKLFIRDSGTSYRFLTARTASIRRSQYIINISDQLKQRPIKPLLDILNKMGASVEFNGDYLKIKGTLPQGIVFDVPADISSQFISSLLLIAPSYVNDLELFLEGEVVSRSYIDMTIRIMQDFGVIADFYGSRIFIHAGQEYNDLDEYTIEPDYSSACYFWAFGALSKSVVSTNALNQTSLQPDYQFLTILEKIGAKIKVEKDRISVSRGELKGISIDMKNTPDQVPTLAVLALFAESKTQIKNIEHLKYKESNRIETLISELSRLGVNISYNNGVLTVNPLDRIPGNEILATYNDHRLAMAFHILKIIFPQITITNASVIAKSYPNFLNDLKSIKN
ncbi:MAG: 3-phosphoshikimate 1-carboxyvinyltransferase [Candidatus Cloacimonetes bacterium]|jgi:3-phosphoshikimate 1-carboxyvinyltransferase|nr:3-phosphoshikimate 1-carboxyvinyltransferase [Candidatus Cloacimonadota bacterium]